MGAGPGRPRPRRDHRPARPGTGGAEEGDAALNDDGFTLETYTAGDGCRWRYRRYPAVGPARARVVCVHGIQSHGGWYVYSCRRLAEAGFEVFFLDRRGAGLNELGRGDAPGFRRLLLDVAEFLEQGKKEDQGRKTFVVGISWGAKLAAGVQKYRPGLMDGVILLCPGFRPLVRLPLCERLGVVWSRLTTPERMVPIPLSDPALFTATEKWLTFLRGDPLALHRGTARLLTASVVLDFYLRDIPRRMRLPVLVLLAGQDCIIDNARTRALIARFAGPTEILEYPEAHHTLEFEPDPDRHVMDMVGWLQRQTGESKPV